MNIDKDRERRLASTGKWFAPGIKTKTNIWSTITNNINNKSFIYSFYSLRLKEGQNLILITKFSKFC